MRNEKCLRYWLGIAGLINNRPNDSLAPWSKGDEQFRALLIFIIALFASPFILLAIVAIAQ